jgi:hypothetical protein
MRVVASKKLPRSMSLKFLTLIFLCMPFGLFAQTSPLSKALKNWIKKSDSELSSDSDFEVKTEAEAQLICQALELAHARLQKSPTEKKTIENIYSLTMLFQDVSTSEAANYLNGKGIPMLVGILSTLTSAPPEGDSFRSNEMMILKMFSLYRNEEGLNTISRYITRNFKSDGYLWSVVLTNVAEDQSKYEPIIQSLNGKIPEDFLGICYLDMCNTIAIQTNTFKHPFNSESGFAYLEKLIHDTNPEHESHVVSAITAIPALNKSYQDPLILAASEHKSIDIQMEVAWAGAKTGDDKSVDKLLSFAKDYRYSAKAISYLEELHLESKVSDEIKDQDFLALSEMCSWLSHPNEFGTAPDHAEVFYKKTLYWPPTKDIRPIYLIRYTYKKRNEDESDEVGIGLVGSVTFSLFGLESALTLKPIELLAIHCNWELEKKDYKNIKRGIELLKKYNKDLE